ncbi:MAG: GNAT family N-acetyltransferase [Lachnospiraceae bacterium]|nr:GNAT family N-acetyltransferase [Lachnospiraceae bacterium]
MVFIEKGILMVELREITKENYEECLNLKIADSQKNFVSSTVHSLAQAWVYYDTAFPFAIYANDEMVGFIMLGYYEVKGYYTLWKFMIDEQYQNKGYGKKALKLG